MDRTGKILGWIAGAIVLIAVVWLLWVWLDDDTATDETVTDNNTQQEQVTNGEDQESLLEQLAENPQNFTGQTVTVNGEVQDVTSNRVFSISDDAVGDEVLVVAQSPLSEEQASSMEQLLQDNANVSVMGEFREFVAADIETEFGVDFDQQLEAEFTEGYVIIAENITITDSGQEFDFPAVQSDNPQEQP